MTETVVLVFEDPAFGLSDLAASIQQPYVVAQNAGVVSISRDSQVCYVVAVDDIEVEGIFEDWPEASIPKQPGAIFSIDYRDPKLLVGIVRDLASRRSFLVDTNYGRVVSGSTLTEDLVTLRP